MLQDAVAVDDNGNLVQEVDPQLNFATNCAEDIVMVCNQGYNVDDDNKPAPENIPEEAAPTVDNEGLFPGQQWGVQHHVDPMEIHGSKKAPEFNDNFDPSDCCSFYIFLKLFPSK